MSDTRTRMIPHGGYVVVCDGRKALVLRNVSVHPKPDLQVQLAFEAPPNPPTHAQGTDRPPRVRLGDQRSAIAQTDWHDLAERRFAKAVAHALDAFDPVTALIVVAPPTVLGDMRKEFHKEVSDRIIAEVPKTLTNHPIDEIEKHLAAA